MMVATSVRSLMASRLRTRVSSPALTTGLATLPLRRPLRYRRHRRSRLSPMLIRVSPLDPSTPRYRRRRRRRYSPASKRTTTRRCTTATSLSSSFRRVRGDPAPVSPLSLARSARSTTSRSRRRTARRSTRSRTSPSARWTLRGCSRRTSTCGSVRSSPAFPRTSSARAWETVPSAILATMVSNLQSTGTASLTTSPTLQAGVLPRRIPTRRSGATLTTTCWKLRPSRPPA
mmetsp:Transcript_23362/g.65605  ORF Transcript_23362/g.65605 Transcript_23362/m.65605 type:complete len:231 (+) Transcript_23362:3622-4314(+)